eukprot:1525688-Prymnesium_polylepis.1
MAHLLYAPREMAVGPRERMLRADEHGRDLVGEARAALLAPHEGAVHIEPHRRAVVDGMQLVPLPQRERARREHLRRPAVGLSVKVRAKRRVEADTVLALRVQPVLGDERGRVGLARRERRAGRAERRHEQLRHRFLSEAAALDAGIGRPLLECRGRGGLGGTEA